MSVRRHWAAALLAVSSGVLSPPLASAEAPPLRVEPALVPVVPMHGHAADPLSPYERTTLDDALKQLGLEVERDPENKIIESVEAFGLEVIEHRDPAPRFLNIFHIKTRDYVIEREVLVDIGQPYRQDLVDETARNLRAIPQISLVLCVPIRSQADGKVRLLVITKDVWSLRLSWDAAGSSGGLEMLLLRPTETNVAGTHQSIAARYLYLPKSQSFGLVYAVPRLFGARLALTTETHLIVGRDTGRPEGSFGGVTVTRPLYSLQTEWGYAGTFAWRNEIARVYSKAQVKKFDSKATPQNDAIPIAYESSVLSNTYGVTRSFGWETKHNLSLGFAVTRNHYQPLDLSAYDPVAAAAFVSAQVPKSDTRVGPVFTYETFRNAYMRVLDFESLGLQEDFHLGHRAFAKVYPVTEALGSSRTFLGLSGGLEYTLAFGDGLARLAGEGVVESTRDAVDDASVSGSFRVVTPRLGFGRLVYEGLVLDRVRNYLNKTTFVGGESRLRGYPSNYLQGSSVVTSNLELRSAPLEIFTCQLGGALFYDVATAFERQSQMRVYDSVGFGLRVLFPQLDRVVTRLDFGVPWSRDDAQGKLAPISFYLAVGQAFPVPTARP